MHRPFFCVRFGSTDASITPDLNHLKICLMRKPNLRLVFLLLLAYTLKRNLLGMDYKHGISC